MLFRSRQRYLLNACSRSNISFSWSVVIIFCLRFVNGLLFEATEIKTLRSLFGGQRYANLSFLRVLAVLKCVGGTGQCLVDVAANILASDAFVHPAFHDHGTYLIVDTGKNDMDVLSLRETAEAFEVMQPPTFV